MPFESLQAVVGTAVIDTTFRKALLNGSRRQVIRSFDLTREEIDVVMAIRANSLQQFAVQLDQWMTQARSKVERPVHSMPDHFSR